MVKYAFKQSVHSKVVKYFMTAEDEDWIMLALNLGKCSSSRMKVALPRVAIFPEDNTYHYFGT